MAYRSVCIAGFTSIASMLIPFVQSWHPVAFRSKLQERNHAPVIRIVEPSGDGVYKKNSLISFAISVSDREDGESKFDEIASDRIFLKARYFSGIPSATRPAPDSASIRIQKGYHRVRQSDCFNCHQFRARSIGPAFTDIALRYKKTIGARDSIAQRVVRGSRGAWGSEIMPAHPDISPADADLIADWIQSEGVTSVEYLRGKRGTVTLKAPEGSPGGYFVLTATYTDNGLAGKAGSAQTTEETVTIVLTEE